MSIFKIAKVNAFPATGDSNTIYFQKGIGEIGCSSKITSSSGVYSPLYPFKYIDGTVANNLVQFKPTTGTFTSITQASSLTVYADGNDRFTLKVLIYTSELTKGTASGDLKIEFDSSLSSVLNFGQNPHIQLSSLLYTSSTSGLPSTIVDAKIKAGFGVNSWIWLNKISTGFSPYDTSNYNPVMVSDLVNHASGSKNLIEIMIQVSWLY